MKIKRGVVLDENDYFFSPENNVKYSCSGLEKSLDYTNPDWKQILKSIYILSGGCPTWELCL